MDPSHVRIEVCVDSMESAVAAIKGGASRLELCGNLGIGGGTTPSMGLVRSIKRALPDIEIMIIIRPRTGDFLYTDLEFEIMLEDISLFKREAVTGVVLGVLCADGTVDEMRTRRLVDAANPMQVCFHRAFDMTRDPIEALKAIESIGGITRILTSGHGKSAPEGITTLEAIASVASTLQPPITIMPGSGINPNTVGNIIHTVWWKKIRELHLSGGKWVDSPMQIRKTGMGMGSSGQSEWAVWRTDAEFVKDVRKAAEEALTANI